MLKIEKRQWVMSWQNSFIHSLVHSKQLYITIQDICSVVLLSQWKRTVLKCWWMLHAASLARKTCWDSGWWPKHWNRTTHRLCVRGSMSIVSHGTDSIFRKDRSSSCSTATTKISFNFRSMPLHISKRHSLEVAIINIELSYITLQSPAMCLHSDTCVTIYTYHLVNWPWLKNDFHVSMFWW